MDEETFYCHDCGLETDLDSMARCDDCPAEICEECLLTCSSDDAMDGCGAGLCLVCWMDHVAEHIYEREQEADEE